MSALPLFLLLAIDVPQELRSCVASIRADSIGGIEPLVEVTREPAGILRFRLTFDLPQPVAQDDWRIDVEPAFAPGQSAIPIDPTVDYAATDLVTHTFESVAPGPHEVVVMLVHDDHTPVIPPAINSVRFTVISPQETPVPQPSPAATEVARTVSIGDAVVQTPPAAVLAAELPAVGGSRDLDGGAERDPSVTVWPLAAGAALMAVGVAMPSAQGQAINSTASKTKNAFEKLPANGKFR